MRRYAVNPVGAEQVGVVEAVWRPRSRGAGSPRHLREPVARVRFPGRTLVESIANLEAVEARS